MKNPIKIIFICEGNVCRSPSAAMMMIDMLKKEGLENDFSVSSRGTLFETEGQPIYPQSAEVLKKHGIPLLPHQARHVLLTDYRDNDYLICMDRANLTDLKRFFLRKELPKAHLLLDYTPTQRDILDPYQTRDFEAAYQDIEYGLKGFISYLKEEMKKTAEC
jgi:protein-tyrosine phosphatase